MPITQSVISINTKQAIDILTKTIEIMRSQEISQKLDEAREKVGNEMFKMMQFLFPIVVQVQSDVIQEYGFSSGRIGLVQFSRILRSLEIDSPEIAQLHSVIKSYYLPSVAVHPSPLEDRLNN